MATVTVNELEKLTVGAATDLLLATRGTVGNKMTFSDFADYVIKTYESSVSGQTQSIKSALDELYAAIGGPQVAQVAAAMTDTSKIYVYTGSETGYTNGNWYYYNGTEWVSGGVYNATAVQTDKTLSISGQPADSKETGDKINAEATARAAAIETEAAVREEAVTDLKSQIKTNNAMLINPYYIENYDKLIGVYSFDIKDAGWYNSEFFSLTSGVTYQFCIFLNKPLSRSSYFRLLNNNTVLISRYVSPETTLVKFDYTPSSEISNARFNMSVNVSDYPVSILCYYGANGFTTYIASFLNTILPAFDAFSTVGDATALKINRSYLVKGEDVTQGSNLPEGLAKELPGNPAVILSIASTDLRGCQLIISTNNIFFRTITYSGDTINGGSLWREINKSQGIADQLFRYYDYSSLYSDVNGAYLRRAIEDESLDCTPEGVYGVHNASIYIHNDIMYLFCATNKIRADEDQTQYNIELIRTDLSGNIIDHRAIVSVGDIINGKTIERCQAVGIKGHDTYIEVFVNLYVENGYKEYHIQYDSSSNSFTPFHEVQYYTSAGVLEKAERKGEQYISNNWISIPDHDNVTAVYFDSNNCGIAYTADYYTFYFLKKLTDTGYMGAGGEMALAYSPSNNCLVLAHRTPTDNSWLMIHQLNLQTNKWEDWQRLPDATARPMFFSVNGEIFLANNAPYTRENLTIWRYLTTADSVWSAKGLYEAVSVAWLDFTFTYFDFDVNGSDVYIAGATNGLTKLKVAKIPIISKTKSQVSSKLIDLFS